MKEVMSKRDAGVRVDRRDINKAKKIQTRMIQLGIEELDEGEYNMPIVYCIIHLEFLKSSYTLYLMFS